MASTISAGTTSGTSLNLSGDTSGQLQLRTNGTTTAVTIDTSQNVGVGTSSPASKLSSNVSGAGSVTALNLTNDNNAFAAGTGPAINFGISSSSVVGGFGKIEVLNQTASSGSNAYMAFSTRGSDSLTEKLRISAAGGLSVGTTTDPGAGQIADVSGNVRSVPINSQTSAYVLAASDNGKMVSITTGGVTVNNSIMSAGMVVTIYNNSASSQTITQGTGVTLQWAGQSSSTTGNRTLGLYGMATIVFLSASSAVITGSGLT